MTIDSALREINQRVKVTAERLNLAEVILQAPVLIDAEDRAFVDRILQSITTESKGIFVVLHPNGRMQYRLLNTTRAGAIALLARLLQRNAEILEADLD